MERNRRTVKYIQPASAAPAQDTQKDPAAASEASLPHNRRNSCTYQAQGFRPESNNGQQRKRKPVVRQRVLYGVVLFALVGVFVFASYQVIAYLVQTHQAKQEEQMIQGMIAESQTSAPPEETAAPTPAPTEDRSESSAVIPSIPTANPIYSRPAKPEILIQFTNALAINPDTVGQLQMGESINTYVVQRDNSYYLRRSFTNEYSFSGAIFLDVTCSIYPKSRNLIIHGHNMHNGTAFGKLSRFDEIAYLNKYPHIEFSTLYESAMYTPFAVVYYSVDPDSEIYLDIYRINSMSDQEFLQFVRKVQSMSEYNIPVRVAQSDRILTVTTCATGDADMRFAVFAVESKVM